LLSHARLSREIGQLAQARHSLDRLLSLPDLDPMLRRAALIERARLSAARSDPGRGQPHAPSHGDHHAHD
jgi:hypothetical protein